MKKKEKENKNISYLGISHKYFRQHTISQSWTFLYVQCIFVLLLLFFCLLLLNSSVCKSNILLLKWEKSMLRQYIYADGICNYSKCLWLVIVCNMHLIFSAHLNKRVQNFYDHLLSVVCSLVYKLFTFITYLFKGVGYIQSNLAQIFSIEGESK